MGEAELARYVEFVGSAIENIVTTTDRLFQYAQDESQPADPATKEALRYRTATLLTSEEHVVPPYES
jgi:hypothetical protein